MNDIDIPNLVLDKFGLTAKKYGREWHSPCPQCGGKDRCIWFGDERGNGFCRQCLKTFWLSDLNELDPLEKLERARKARENAARETALQAARLSSWQERAAYRQGWHDALSFAAREWWHAQGITDESIDWYGLGVCQYPLVNQRTQEQRDFTAYTIPIHDPETWQIVNTQYRLENPPEGLGKYRQERGLAARSFYAMPHTGEDCLVVEGAKKAIVLRQLLGETIQVVGLPGITPAERLIDELLIYKRKYLLPDPDVENATLQRFRDHLPNLRVVRLPVKPDDAVTKYGFDKTDLRAWLSQYRN